MKRHFITILAAAATLTIGTSASAADLNLPGSTLGTQTEAGVQPVNNPDNVVGDTVSPECPFLGQSFQQLLRYARGNWPAIYRQALALRRAGAPQEAVRVQLEMWLCTQEGY